MLDCAGNRQQHFCRNDWLSSANRASLLEHTWGPLALPGILPRRLDRQRGTSVVTARDAVVYRGDPSMTPKKLTDSQLVLLSAAAQRADGAVELTGNRKGAVVKKVITNLLNDGLVEQVPAGGSLPVWRSEARKTDNAPNCRDLGQSNNAVFCSDIGPLVWRGHQTVRRGDIDDAAPFVGEHRR
jgi:hypothetical protein